MTDPTTRIVELEVAAKEALELIEWFEGWLNNREEPVRYDPIDLVRHPPVFSVNYDEGRVAEIKKFIKEVLGERIESVH